MPYLDENCDVCTSAFTNDQWACRSCLPHKRVKLAPKARDASDGRSWRFAPFIFNQPGTSGESYEQFYNVPRNYDRELPKL